MLNTEYYYLTRDIKIFCSFKYKEYVISIFVMDNKFNFLVIHQKFIKYIMSNFSKM